MIIRDIKHWNSYASFNGIVVNGVSFLDSDQISSVYRACNANKNMLCDLFDKIGIKYDDISSM